ncbi:TB2/DP1, HVA22 family protein [Spironucleus salmonicida]|uniref:TB2/DP1, HVA22 family protein n=1 Tax=Spironucleus salmonicida TaxID=348837 RepID=V6LSY1_9EUKA|nr:TB2/DP1, HVA22 family protein [Spironucleus salmonicida]|eukprot:EST43904.1 TB2/DP1, HVA22 family protein [Spironucleus salmonicida]
MIEKMPFYIQQIYALIIPMYRSVKFLQKRKLSKPLLTYWAIYGLFLVLEKTFGFIVYVPFYMVFKFYLLIWLIQSRGSEFIYQKFIQPYVEVAVSVVEDQEYRKAAIQKSKTLVIDVGSTINESLLTPLRKTPLGQKFVRFE